MEFKGSSKWGATFNKTSRAYLTELWKEELNVPDQYVYKPATGVDAVEINDFESVSTDFFSPESSGRKNWDGVTDESHSLHGFAHHNFMAMLFMTEQSMASNRSVKAKDKKRPRSGADVASAKPHDNSARDLFMSLHPTQQDVLLCLKDYASLVSWLQVTPAARQSDDRQDVKPWKSLERILSPDALLATSLILEEYMADMAGVVPEPAPSDQAPGQDGRVDQNRDAEMAR